MESEDEEVVMTTTAAPRREDVRSGATGPWWSADARGPRRHQADAAAGGTPTGPVTDPVCTAGATPEQMQPG